MQLSFYLSIYLNEMVVNVYTITNKGFPHGWMNASSIIEADYRVNPWVHLWCEFAANVIVYLCWKKVDKFPQYWSYIIWTTSVHIHRPLLKSVQFFAEFIPKCIEHCSSCRSYGWYDYFFDNCRFCIKFSEISKCSFYWCKVTCTRSWMSLDCAIARPHTSSLKHVDILHVFQCWEVAGWIIKSSVVTTFLLLMRKLRQMQGTRRFSLTDWSNNKPLILLATK